ncbi:MAG: cysteine synthase A [Clostridiales bacterium]|nr:cysteine synthase A [Clostridiales bacterium]
MMKIQNIDGLVGNTPLMEIKNIEDKENLSAKILVKLECFNPAGSIKDRAAKFMLDDAEESGVLKKGGAIIEPTSGNTGIGLTAIGVPRGYRVILTMPETMSKERVDLLKAYGAEVVLTDGKKGMLGAIEKAEELKTKIKGSFIPDQFSNPANVKAHYATTGPEIYKDTQGNINFFVAGVGTGGTLSGTGRYLKEKISNLKVVAVEPKSSPMLSLGVAGAHKIQGIGANFVPKNFNRSICDEIIGISDEDAYYWTKTMAKEEGILVGISSGAALAAAINIAKRKENKGKTIVVILPDTGNRYLSTGVYTE